MTSIAFFAVVQFSSKLEISSIIFATELVEWDIKYFILVSIKYVDLPEWHTF